MPTLAAPAGGAASRLRGTENGWMAGPVQSGAKARDSARIGPWRRGRHGCREVSVAAAHQITVVEPVVPVGECPRRNFTRDIGFVPVFDQGAAPGFGRSGPYSTRIWVRCLDLVARERIAPGSGCSPCIWSRFEAKNPLERNRKPRARPKSTSPRAIWRLAALARTGPAARGRSDPRPHRPAWPRPLGRRQWPARIAGPYRA